MDQESHSSSKNETGSQGFEVSKLGFGCGGLSGILNAPLSHEAGAEILREAFDKGITFFDTADVYGERGDNDIMIGKGLKMLPPEQVQVASKFDVSIPDMSRVEVKGSPEYVRQCVEASLRRLDVDYIDLYYQHRVDKTVAIQETMGELKKGKLDISIYLKLVWTLSREPMQFIQSLPCRWSTPYGVEKSKKT